MSSAKFNVMSDTMSDAKSDASHGAFQIVAPLPLGLTCNSM